jgi:hypothetical protein
MTSPDGLLVDRLLAFDDRLVAVVAYKTNHFKSNLINCQIKSQVFKIKGKL